MGFVVYQVFTVRYTQTAGVQPSEARMNAACKVSKHDRTEHLFSAL